MKKSLLFAPLLLVAACAGGPPVQESMLSHNAIEPGMSKIVVYRTGLFGTAIQPKVAVDGKEIGRCVPKGVAIADVKAGQHTVSATTEVRRELSVEAPSQSVAYVKCGISMGLMTGRPVLENVSPELGKAEASDLKVVR